MSFKNRTFFWFAWLIGLFVVGYAFAQEAASGESDSGIQMFIGALNEHLGAAANFLFFDFFL